MPKIKCIANVDCQTRGDDGKIRFYQAGGIEFFEKKPENNWSTIEEASSGGVDFKKVPEHLLREPDVVSLDSLVEYIHEVYGENYEGYERNEVVNQFLSLKSGSNETLSTHPGVAPTAAEFKGGSGSDSPIGISVEVGGDTPELYDVEDGVEDGGDDLSDLLK